MNNNIIDIPNFCFINKDRQSRIVAEQNEISEIEKLSFDNGLFTYLKGAEYPMRVITTPQIVADINIVKAIFTEILKIRLNPVAVLSAFNRVGCKILDSHFLKDEYMSPQIRELKQIIYNFIFEIVKIDNIARDTSLILSHIVEYDNAYRLRFIDLASEANKEAFIFSPVTEMKRLIEVWINREAIMGKGMANKIKLATRLLLFLLYIPKYKKAFKVAISKADFTKLAYDNIDQYWAFLRNDYNYKGMSFRSRMAVIHSNELSIPILKKVDIV